MTINSRTRVIGRLGLALAVLGLAVPALGQVNTADAQNKLLAKRAAEADAYRKLAECIKGMQITSETRVRDFVTESDVIESSLDTFIKGIRLGKPTWYADLSCEVPAEVTVAKLITELKEIHTRHYDGNRVTGKDIEQMKQHIKKDVIKVIGMGAPREDLPPDLPEGVEDVITPGPPTPPQPPLPDLWLQIGPRARLMATRAAELDAKRQLLERIKGMRITSDTVVRDFVAESDRIDTIASGTLVGASVTRRYYHDDEPIAEVTVQVPLESVIRTIKAIHARSIQGDRVKATDIQKVTTRIKRQTFEATGMGIPPQKYIKKYEAQAQRKYDTPDWAMQKIRMDGNGVPPQDKAGTAQGKLLAARAAELDAKRRLAEYVRGLQISSETQVRDFVTEHDEISTYMDAVLVGAMVEKTEFDGETATVTVSIPGMELWEPISERLRIVYMGG